MAMEFFYSKSLNLYVARQPLKVDARVSKAAFRCGINLQWDDEGRINLISFEQACILLQELGSVIVSPAQYWKVLKDAKAGGDDQMIEELTSDQYTEWLSAIFEGPEIMTENPVAVQVETRIEFHGQRRIVQTPFGRPGWIELKDINAETGLPVRAELNRERHAVSWKYWSVTHNPEETVAPIRGYVTSAGMPSLDLDIPVTARQPNLMVRECRREPLAPAIPLEILEKAEKLIAIFDDLNGQEKYFEICDQYSERIFGFIQEFGSYFQSAKEMDIRIIREKLIDMLGILRIMAISSGDLVTQEQVSRIARQFVGLNQPVSEMSFKKFVVSSRQRLQQALSRQVSIVFVLGHKNPDSDTVVSSLFEAYRNYLVDQSVIYLPIVQSNRVPDEVRRLLGDEMADGIILLNEKDYQQVIDSGQARWILVDHNKSEFQKFALTIVDHHVPCEIALRQNIVKSLQMIGSCTALVVQKYYGMGIDIPKGLARIMYGATLMDTENRSRLKMRQKDRLIMEHLGEVSGISDSDGFYQDLMGYLLNTDDAELLFGRDYKEDWGLWGFAVAKVIGGFDANGHVLKQGLIDRLVEAARQNNKEKNFPLTVVKFVDFKTDKAINRERFYFVWADGVVPEFKEALFELVEQVVKVILKGKIRIGDNYIEFWDTLYGAQLSRKRVAPMLELIVTAFTRYFYSVSTGLYVKRDFLEAKPRVKEVADECGFKLYWDEQGKVNHINFGEVKTLLDKLDLTFMTLSQYWKVRQDVLAVNDAQMISSLHSTGFVEFLDTIIEDHRFLIDNPVISDDGYEGERRLVEIPVAEPGLIRVDFIDLETGVPTKVLPPDNFEDRTLWRYWSPDAYHTIATRSHIFLIDQPSLDFKLHPEEALPNLVVRPCCYQVVPPQVQIQVTGDIVAVIIEQDGETSKIGSDQLGL